MQTSHTNSAVCAVLAVARKLALPAQQNRTGFTVSAPSSCVRCLLLAMSIVVSGGRM
jgi:hypothetical protein